jgi:hypothetical protein
MNSLFDALNGIILLLILTVILSLIEQIMKGGR